MLEARFKKIVAVVFVCLILVLSLIIYLHWLEDRQPFVAFLSVGQGDAALIRLDNGAKILVDCGPDRKILSALGHRLPFYDRTIDYLIITHPDLDHYGGCLEALKRYQVKEIWTNGESGTDGTHWETWRQLVADEGAREKIIQAPEIWNAGQTRLEFLAPDESLLASAKKDNNAGSVVFRLLDDNFSALFTGDMETPLENALLEKYCSSTPIACPSLRAEYLKVGHHGSDSSSGDEFLRAVAPTTAVISVGKNSFGHPSLRVLRKLERQGAKIWRADQSGDLVVKSRPLDSKKSLLDNFLGAWYHLDKALQ